MLPSLKSWQVACCVKILSALQVACHVNLLPAFETTSNLVVVRSSTHRRPSFIPSIWLGIMSTNSNISYGHNFFIFIILVILAHEGVSAYIHTDKCICIHVNYPLWAWPC